MKLVASYCITCILCLSLLGCSSKDGGVREIRLSGNTVETLGLEEWFDVADTVQIAAEEFVLGRISKVIADGEDFYVWDNQGVHRFTRAGKYLNSIGVKGRGPREYLEIADLSVRDGLVAILDGSRKVLLFNREGRFIRQAELSFFAASCHLLKDRLLLHSAYQEPTEKFHAYSLPDLVETAAFQEIQQEELTWRHFKGQHNFFLTRDSVLLFHEPLNRKVLSISGDECRPFLAFDFFGKNGPSSFWEKRFASVKDVFDQMMAEDISCGIPLFATDGAVTVLSFTGQGQYLLTIHDSSRTPSDVRSGTVSYKGVFRNVPMASFDNVVFSFNSARDLSIVVPPAYLTSTAKDNGNPMLVFLAFRER